jgi:cyanophycinase
MSNRFMVRITIGLAVALLWVSTAAQAQEPTEYGPPKGTLLIVGGGSLKDSGIPEKFIELAGGKEAKIVVVPTAGGNKNKDGSVKVYNEDDVLKSWRARGLTHVTMLHTADPKVADTPEFVKPLTEANAVWFEGGRQWNIVDSYASTLTYKEFHRLLARGGVIGGSSAGATIQGDFLVRGAIEGSTKVVAPEPEHHQAFAFLRKSAIDQHINTRNRWDDLIPLIKDHPDLLGIGLSENTAIIVHGDRFEVIGAWKVAVHDNTRLYQPWEKPYYVLSVGDVYNMKTRKIEKLGIGSSGPAQDTTTDAKSGATAAGAPTREPRPR